MSTTMLYSEIAALGADNERLREALMFYGDAENYVSSIGHTAPFMLNGRQRTDAFYRSPKVAMDRGAIARAVLEPKP